MVQRWLKKPAAGKYELVGWVLYSCRELVFLPFAISEGAHFYGRDLLFLPVKILSSNFMSLVLPFACYFVLGAPPLLLFVRKFSNVAEDGSVDGDLSDESALTEAEVSSRPDGYSRLLADLRRSKRLADDTLRRTNTHLLLGLFTAIAGVAVFYMLSQTAPISFPSPVSWGSVLAYVFASLPRVAVLVFIEVTAGFFLKQYRYAMNDFRHFEQLQRRREDVLISYQLRVKHGGNVGTLADRLAESSPAPYEPELDGTNDHAKVILEIAKAFAGSIGKKSTKGNEPE